MSELEQKIRDLINDPRTHFQLSKDPSAFSKLCSSLDVLGDTELALDTYLSGDENASFGEKYLFVYGVLQALFIQQDAVEHLCEALHLDYEAEPSLKRIRGVRNEAIGHPTKRGRGKNVTFHQISRISITQRGFDLMTTDTSGDAHISDVDVRELIGLQRDALRNTLTDVIKELERDEMEHREKFRSEKLVRTFPETLGYTYEKIAETIYGKLPPQIGENLVKSIMESIAAFKSALEVRGILEAYESSIGNLLGDLEYSLNELRRYFGYVPESKLNRRDAAIFLFFVSRKMEELIVIAKELDEHYATGFPT